MERYFRSIIQLPRAVKWFLCTEMFFGLGIGIWNVNLNFHLKASGQSDLGIGSLLAFASVATALLSAFAGGICDRIGFHPAMKYGCILKGLGMAVVALAPGTGIIYAGLLIMGLGDAFVLSCEFPFILSLVEPEHRDLVYNLLICFFLFAMFFGNIIGGYLPGIFAGMADPFLISVLVSGILFILLGLARSLLPKRKVDFSVKKVSLGSLKNRKVLAFLIFGVVFSMAFNILASMLNIIYRDSFHLKESSVGMIYSVATMVMFVSSFLVPLIIKRWNSVNVPVVFMAFIVPILALMSIANVNMFIILWTLYSFSRMTIPGTVDCRMLQAIPDEIQGSYSGLRIFANNLGMAAGASLAGVILQYSSYSMILLASSALVAVQLMVYMGCRKYLKREVAI